MLLTEFNRSVSSFRPRAFQTWKRRWHDALCYETSDYNEAPYDYVKKNGNSAV